MFCAGGHINFLVFLHPTHPYGTNHQLFTSSMYLGVTVMHIPCFAVFALVIKMKRSLLRRHNS
ncbi:hypothetical protein F2Q68_00013186 [Brassica cretica]|uniref:Uncharacterized protein n=1 Tax=Brassica cretica TaxID=69181 RepID=A0A8S9HAA6_BRACR|nr:hypothetical protein F2Q68_00013186 [Brassica cretica]